MIKQESPFINLRSVEEKIFDYVNYRFV